MIAPYVNMLPISLLTHNYVYMAVWRSRQSSTFCRAVIVAAAAPFVPKCLHTALLSCCSIRLALLSWCESCTKA